MSARKLYKFHGGIKVDDFKNRSNHKAIDDIPLPATLIIPLRQHIGQPARPIVEIGQKVKKYQVLALPADSGISSYIHAPTAGEISAIKPHPIIHESGISDICIFIKTSAEDDEIEVISDYRTLSDDEIFTRIKKAGIVGMGGAGFPSDIKAEGGIKHKIDTLIINAAECEPYITCDDRLMRENPGDILAGIEILQKLVTPEKIVIAIEDNKPEAYTALFEAIENPEIEIVQIPTIYPSGGERQLVKVLTNREVRAGQILAELGLLCFNVSTVYAIYEAVVKNKPLIERVVTITGDKCKNSGNYRIKIGTPISFIAKYFGILPEHKLICGGPMMGFAVNSVDAPISKTSNCLIALDKDFNNDIARAPCIRCGKCVEVCPAYLLPQQLYWYCKASDFANAEKYNIADCIECNCCTHVCPSNIPLVDYYKFGKMQIRNLEQKRQKADYARMRHDNREARLERIKQERIAKRTAQKRAIQEKLKQDKSTAKDDNKTKIIAAAKAKVESRN